MQKKMRMTVAAFSAAITVAAAGDLTVEGNLNVTSNLAARTLSVTNATVGALVVEGSAVFAGPLAGDGSAITNLSGANLAAGSVGSGSLAAGAVSADKIPAGAISGAHIAADAAIAPSRIAGLTDGLAQMEASISNLTAQAATSVNRITSSDNRYFQTIENGTGMVWRIDPGTGPKITFTEDFQLFCKSPPFGYERDLPFDDGVYDECGYSWKCEWTGSSWVLRAGYIADPPEGESFWVEEGSCDFGAVLPKTLDGSCEGQTKGSATIWPGTPPTTNLVAVFATTQHVAEAIGAITAESLGALTNEADLAALRMYHYGSPEIVESPAEWFRNHPDVPSMIGFTLTPEIITNWNIVVPWQLNGVEVRKIMTGYCRDIKSIRLPKTITHIEQNSFSECTSLCSVVYNGNVDYVGYGAFSLCPSLTNVTFCCNQPVFDEQDWFYMTHSDCVITVLNPQATGWGDTLSDGYRSIPVVRPALYADAVYQAGQLLATTGDVAQALSSLYPSANPSNYVSASAVDGIVAAATANLLASTGSGSQLTGITAAQVGAYTVNETDAAISSALAGFEPGAGVLTNHVGDVRINGAVQATALAGDGASVTNLNLAAYAGDNLTWAGGRLHAEDGGPGYTDAQAVAAVTAADLDMNAHRVTGVAAPTADSDAITKAYLRAVLSALPPQGNLSMGAYTNGAPASFPLEF